MVPGSRCRIACFGLTRGGARGVPVVLKIMDLGKGHERQKARVQWSRIRASAQLGVQGMRVIEVEIEDDGRLSV